MQDEQFIENIGIMNVGPISAIKTPASLEIRFKRSRTANVWTSVIRSK